MGLGRDAVAAMNRDDLEAAGQLLDRMARELHTHWRGEEDGLFAAMRKDREYEGYISALVREHRDLESLLATADLSTQSDRDLIRAAIVDLAEHIRKEEDGLFPASLTALDGDAWNRSIAAWQEAHPGSSLQTTGS
jgi:iron-sulfur cluster repair protein YtfE (RIC family)